MVDFAAARRMMVDGQVRTSDVTDPGLIGAMLDLPRESFLPPEKADLAYLDMDVAVADNPRLRNGCVATPQYDLSFARLAYVRVHCRQSQRLTLKGCRSLQPPKASRLSVAVVAHLG